MHGAITD